MSGGILSDGILTVQVPAGWIALPGQDEDAGARIAEIVDGLDFGEDRDEPAGRLAAALGTVTAIAAALPAGARRSFAFVIAPHTGRVEAMLSMRVSRITPGAYDNYLIAARSFSGDESTEVIRRTVEEVELPTGRGVLSHDFTLPVAPEGVPNPAMERTFLALFPHGGETGVEFTLLTQNLALFSDTGAYLMALAAGEDPSAGDD